MTIAALPANLPQLLRQAGLDVVEIDGWRSRKRPGSFGATGVLNHHTGASAQGWSLTKELQYARWMFLTGRSDLNAPLVQIALGRSGRVYIGAAGRANHAGKAKASGSVSAGDGNKLYVGIEWMLSGNEHIPDRMRKAGTTLNAVLTEKVLKTSVRTISAHYQTSVTGKWDIGDPAGISFRGHRVLDVNKFRKEVQAERARLFAPVKQPSNGYKIKIGHCSLQFSDGPKMWQHDVALIFARGYQWITGTEAGEAVNWRILYAEAKRRGYTIRRYKSNWIAISNKIVKQGTTVKWGVQTLVDNDLVAGPGHDSNYIFATFVHSEQGVGTISVVSSHYPTKGTPVSKDPARRVNLKWTTLMGKKISAKMADLGEGSALAFYGGDQNIEDSKADTFFGGDVTSCWDELKKYPGTGHGTIDVIATYDRDTRVRCLSADSFTDKELFLHTDHYLVEATYQIERLAA
jgi:hypothetical protein